MWHVYILKCCDGSYYVGMTENLNLRLLDHNRGKGSLYTRLRRPVEMVYGEEFDNKNDAVFREIELKQFSRKNKEGLIKYGKDKNVKQKYILDPSLVSDVS